MAQNCEDCLHWNKDGDEEPCVSCTATTTYSNFTPKKDLNQILREKFGDKNESQPDIVNRPSHYMLKPGLEVRDVLELLVDKLQQTLPYPGNTPLFEADYVQMMQYLMRFMDKNGKQDLEKARWYLDKLIEAYE